MPLKLHLGIEGDANIYLNGIHIGRYLDRGWQRDYFLPEPFLNRNGSNVIAIVVRGEPESGGLYEASIEPTWKSTAKSNQIEILW